MQYHLTGNANKILVVVVVVSLFTKIPVDLAIKVAEKRLKQDALLGQRTSLPVEDLIDLLSVCLNTTQFTYNGTYYQQVFGTAMGSPVSARCHCQHGNGRCGTKGSGFLTGPAFVLETICRRCHLCGIRKRSGTPSFTFKLS